MPPAVAQQLAKLQRTMAGFSAGQKVIAVLLTIGVVIGAVAFGKWVTAPTYAPLFSNLAGSDASAIVDKLDADGTKYQLQDGGSTILVPKDVVYAERVKMSGAGLPASTDAQAGYSLLDKQGVTASDFQQNVAYQRAMEGELAKTISAIDGVGAAVVHLAIPKKDVFVDDSQKPTASVLVSMQPGHVIGADSVQSIVHLVASSVEGMDPKDVTVADSTGRLLSSTDGTAGSAASDQNAAATEAYEESEAADLQAVLDRVLGPGKAVATVNATLDFDDTSKKTTRVYTDAKAKPLASSETKETYGGGSGGGSGTSGVLGTDNIAVPNAVTGTGTGADTGAGTGTGTGTGGAGTGYTKTSTTQNNSQSTEETDSHVAPGGVLKQSVAVLVDSKAAGGVDLAKLQENLSAAAGIDTKRGDTISLQPMAFDTTAAAAAAKELKAAQSAQQRSQLLGYAKQGGIVLLVVAALLIAFLKSRKKSKAAAAQGFVQLDVVEQQSAARTAALAALPAGGSPAALDGVGPVAALEGAPAPVPAPELPQQRRRDDVAALVERQPDEVAELLRGWLADRRG